MKMTVFWDIVPCSIVEVDPTFDRCFTAVSQKAVIFILAAVRT
jgi:hypothetical protein